MASVVLPGQALQEPGLGAQLQPGAGVFERRGTLFATRLGVASRDGATLSVTGRDTSIKVPDLGDVVVGRVTRISRIQATMTIQLVNGVLLPDEADYQGVIRSQDVRQTEQDKVKVWLCFRPGDVVRATVLSLGDSRQYYLTTARNDLGVVHATDAETGERLEAVGWAEMRVPSTGEMQPRKVAGPTA